MKPEFHPLQGVYRLTKLGVELPFSMTGRYPKPAVLMLNSRLPVVTTSKLCMYFSSAPHVLLMSSL